MSLPSGYSRARLRARKPFGERVAVVSDLLGGSISRAEACRRLGIAEPELDEWIRVHARDRPVSLSEFRTASATNTATAPAPTPEQQQLHQHLARLRAKLRSSQRELLLLRQLARARGLL